MPIVPVAFDTTQITSTANGSNPQPGDPCHPLARGAHAPAIAYRITPNDGAYETGDIAASLTTGTDNSAISVVEPVAFSMRGRDGEPQAEWAPAGLAPALRTTGGGSSYAFVADQWAVRRLTPTECERLMGVPDGFTAITYRGKPAADAPRYKALGNSQAVNNMRWIAHGLRAVINAQVAA